MIFMRSSGAVAVLVMQPEPAPASVCSASLYAWLIGAGASAEMGPPNGGAGGTAARMGGRSAAKCFTRLGGKGVV